jgi:hypothetical protein
MPPSARHPAMFCPTDSLHVDRPALKTSHSPGVCVCVIISFCFVFLVSDGFTARLPQEFRNLERNAIGEFFGYVAGSLQ